MVADLKDLNTVDNLLVILYCLRKRTEIMILFMGTDGRK